MKRLRFTDGYHVLPRRAADPHVLLNFPKTNSLLYLVQGRKGSGKQHHNIKRQQLYAVSFFLFLCFFACNSSGTHFCRWMKNSHFPAADTLHDEPLPGTPPDTHLNYWYRKIFLELPHPSGLPKRPFTSALCCISEECHGRHPTAGSRVPSACDKFHSDSLSKSKKKYDKTQAVS